MLFDKPENFQFNQKSNGSKLSLHFSKPSDFSSLASYVIPTVILPTNKQKLFINSALALQALQTCNFYNSLDPCDSVNHPDGNCPHKRIIIKIMVPILVECRLESVQDFLINLDINPLMHLLEISTF
jgi:hypothetical protein